MISKHRKLQISNIRVVKLTASFFQCSQKHIRVHSVYILPSINTFQQTSSLTDLQTLLISSTHSSLSEVFLTFSLTSSSQPSIGISSYILKFCFVCTGASSSYTLADVSSTASSESHTVLPGSPFHSVPPFSVLHLFLPFLVFHAYLPLLEFHSSLPF